MPAAKYIVNLTLAERADLQQLVRAGTTAARKLMRARVLLKADDGLTDAEVAEHVGVGTATVARIRQRCVEEGLAAALVDRPHRGALPKFTGKQQAHLIALACSTPPAGRARWTLRLWADRGVALGFTEHCSYETIRQVLKKTRSSRGRSAPGVSRPSGRLS
jgi:transposase